MGETLERVLGNLARYQYLSGGEAAVTAKTGLLFDPYFSATKIAWLLDHVPGARRAAEAGKLAFGTIDSFLLWRLTGGKVHATDATNAARTLLLNCEDAIGEEFQSWIATSPDASSCGGWAPAFHQTMSFLMVSSFLKARSTPSSVASTL